MDIDFRNKNVIIRVDFNVPIRKGVIENTLRIDKSLPTIQECIQGKPNRILLISHLGRPNGRFDKKLSLKIIVPYLEEKLNHKIGFSNNINISNDNSKIILLENIRFYKEEEEEINDNVIQFRHRLTRLGDIYINDAFGCSHRAHSSIIGINCPVKIRGLLFKKEIEFLLDNMKESNKPILAIIGGAKVKDKIQLLSNLIPKLDYLIIGGGMSFTFLKKNGISIGDSLFDEDGYTIVDKVNAIAEKNNTKIYLPVDFIVSDEFSNHGQTKKLNNYDGIEKGWMGLDIGSQTIKLFNAVISRSKTIFWNGPMGVFEMSNFENGSHEIAKTLVEATKNGAKTIICGGDTMSCVSKFNLGDQYTHLSTGGGASLKLLEGSMLVGIKGLV